MPRNSAAAEDRLSAIEILLLWEGRVSRGRLLEMFDVHETVASRDLATFRRAHPDAAVLVPGAKVYERSSWMMPARTEGRFSDYQRLIGAWPSGLVAAGVPMVTASVDATQISFEDFSAIHRAIRDGQAVQLTYRSLRHPAPHARTVRPHTLIQAGPRWHVRGWCTKSEEFRDFNLGRISNAKLTDRGDMPDVEADADWNATIVVRLIPHRDLEPKQKQMVRDEYMHGATAIRHEARLPMVRYWVHAHRAALDPELHGPPDYLLMVDEPDKLPTAATWIR